ncbi:hypothetical protein Tco_0268232 [Tanacetum coccineum]
MMRMRSFRGGGASGSADSVVAPVVTHFPLFLRRQSRFKTDESAATPPSPPAYRTTARISIRPEAPMPFPSEEEEQDIHDIYDVIEDTQDRQTQLFQRVDGLVEDRQFHYETARLLDQEALDYRIASQVSLMTTLIAHVSSLQGQLSAALGQIQALYRLEALKKMMTVKYFPRGEIKKLEIKLWNLKVKGTDVASYTLHFLELPLMCGRMFHEESDEVEKYVGGLPDMIRGNVMSYQPKTMEKAIEFAKDQMDHKVLTVAERQAEQKKKLEFNAGNNQGHQQQNKRHNTRSGFTHLAW